VRDFRELKVWKKAHGVVLEIYRLTETFPADERFGLTSQMRRCAASIPANIAEGCGRDTDQDFARFLQIAAGSACELEYHLILSRDLGFLASDAHQHIDDEIQEIKRMLNAFTTYLRSRGTSSRRISEEPPPSYLITRELNPPSLTPNT
jgi:four helix bundle protein